MPQIKWSNNDRYFGTVMLEDGTVSLGRAEDNDLHLADTTVSAHHARIFTYQNASYIEDLDSTNGVYVNGKKSLKHTLHNGDIVNLGKLKLQVNLKAATDA